MVILCLLGALALSAAPGTLQIHVNEGSGATVARNAVSPQRLQVTVAHPSGEPASGVTVTFQLPAGGPSGLFASGLRSESLLTDAKGQAYVRGIQWNDTPGPLEIRVIATSGSLRAETAIPIEISATKAPPPEPKLAKRSSSKRTVIIIAAVAAGAVGGLALRGGKSTPPAAVAPLILPPSIGIPVITVGKPQ